VEYNHVLAGELPRPELLTLEGLAYGLREQAMSPPGGDDRIAAFDYAMLAALEDPKLRGLLEEGFEHRYRQGRSVSPQYGANLCRHSFQKHFLRAREKFGYPEAFLEEDAWKEGINEIVHGQDSFHELRFDLLVRDIQSNVAERYKSLKIIMHFFRERLGDEPLVLDVGCSQNQGLKKIAAGYPFDPVEVVIRNKDGTPTVAGLDYKSTSAVNSVIAARQALGPSLGVDAWPLRDLDVKQWARGSSFYPSELLIPGLLEKYDELDNLQVGNVGFLEANFTEKNFGNEAYKMFDIALFSTVLYQLSPEERDRMLVNALYWVKPNGLVIIQDFTETVEGKPLQLYFPDKRDGVPFLYKTIVLDPSRIEEGFKECIRWQTPRCRQMEVNLDILAA